MGMFLYPALGMKLVRTGPDNNISISRLKSSLSETLLNFQPAFGRLSFLPSTGDVVIDCARQNNSGVSFIYSECDDTVSVDKIADDPVHDVELFKRLVPSIDNDAMPVPVAAVQVTRFKSGGGAAVGVTMHHAIVDGMGIWTFIKAWARACKGAIDMDACPIINDRAVLLHRIGREDVARRFVSQLAPALPNIKATGIPLHDDISVLSNLELTRRTFFISRKTIKTIKEKIAKDATYGKLFKTPPSRFVVVTSLFWVCFSHVRSVSPDDTSTFSFSLDCRPYLEPPVPESFTGNCVKSLQAKIKWRELQSENGVVNACIQTARAIEEGKKDVLKGCEEWASEMLPPSVNMWIVGSGTGITPYDTDFGWGKPKRVELVNFGGDGCSSLCELEDGGIQVSIVLSSDYVDRFVEELDKLLCTGDVKVAERLLSRI